MQAVLLAGGLGTRLSEETYNKPKPMVEIGGKPILWHILKSYSFYGINDFIICCGYKGYLIKEYFANYFLHNCDVTLDLSSNSVECLKQVSNAPPSLLILDIWLKDSNMDGIDILKKVKVDYPQVPVVIISGHGNIEIAVSAIKQGAYDFIEKPFNIEQLLVVVRRAMETSSLRQENKELKQKDIFEYDLKGESVIFRNLVANLEKV